MKEQGQVTGHTASDNKWKTIEEHILDLERQLAKAHGKLDALKEVAHSPYCCPACARILSKEGE